jgi:[ribosomal protein S5]-alanine N-acetyltransferase
MNNITIREMTIQDIDHIADYWMKSSGEHLRAMGVDITKIPGRDFFTAMLNEQYHKPLQEKRSYCLIWLLDEQPVGHCNTNPTFFGKEAYMHLHLWNAETRKKGIGYQFLGLSIPKFFETLELNRLISEPYALNPAPNKSLEKIGFVFEREYTTTPGSLNFEQPVKRWVMTRKRFYTLFNS